MKKIFISILSLCALVASAQDEEVTYEVSSGSGSGFMANSNKELSFESKNGHQVLPQAGDWGLGIAADNPLDFFGGLVGQSSGDTDGFESVNGAPGVTNDGTTIFGKYFVNSNTAYRGWVTTQARRRTSLLATADDGDATNTAQPIYDKQVINNRGILVGAGLEKRRGAGRLIGIYGAQGYLGFGQGNVTKNTYANEISATNTDPSDGIAGNNNTFAIDGVTDHRVVSVNNTSEFVFGAQGFLGVEYFFAPKISLGGEFNVGLEYRPDLKSSTVVEYFNANSGAVEEFTRQTTGGSETNFSTANSFGGSLNLNFYF